MSKKNTKTVLSFPYATVTKRTYGGVFLTVINEAGSIVLNTTASDEAEAYYLAAKKGCKVMLDGEKVKAIPKSALAKAQEEKTETRFEIGRSLTKAEIEALPTLFVGAKWLYREKALFAEVLYGGNCRVFAEEQNDGVVIVMPYERPISLHMSGYREETNRLNDDGKF